MAGYAAGRRRRNGTALCHPPPIGSRLRVIVDARPLRRRVMPAAVGADFNGRDPLTALVAVAPKLAKFRPVTEDSVDHLVGSCQQGRRRLQWMRRNPLINFFGIGVLVSRFAIQARENFASRSRV